MSFPFDSDRRVLLVVAAPAETAAVWRAFRPSEPAPLPPGRGALARGFTDVSGRFDVVESGIGKVNAALAVARAADPARHSAVLAAGVCGSLPGSNLRPGAVIAATSSVYADEGVLASTDTGEEFVDCATMGFPLGPFEEGAVPCTPAMVDWLLPAADASGAIATVSTCSGTDALAHAVRARTAALAEAMEGAAVGHAAARLWGGEMAFGELRVVSNFAGDRRRQAWDLGLALSRLTEVLGRLSGEGCAS